MKVWTTFEILPLFPKVTGWSIRLRRGEGGNVELTLHWNNKPDAAHMFILSADEFRTISEGVLPSASEPTPYRRVQSDLDAVVDTSQRPTSSGGIE